MSRLWPEKNAESERERLSASEATELARHLAGLAAADLPLPSGLFALSLEVPSRRLARMLGDLSSKIEDGAPLEIAIESQGTLLPATLRGLITAGVRSGRLADSLSRFLEMEDLSNSLRRRLRAGLAYPALMFLVSSCLFVYVSKITMDGFEGLFKDFGIQLPWITQLLLHASKGFSALGWWALFGPLAGFFLIWLAMRITLGPVERARLVHGIPLVGPLARDIALAQFCPVLEMLLESEVALPEALRLAADSSRDAALADAVRGAALEVEAGQSLGESLRDRPPFPTGFDVFLSWADEHRGLTESLKLSAESFETRARARAIFISKFCNVMTMTAVIWWVSLTVLALFLPLVRLLSVLSGGPLLSNNDEWPEELQMAGIGVVSAGGVGAVVGLVWRIYWRNRSAVFSEFGSPETRTRRDRPFAHYYGMGWLLVGLSVVSLFTSELLMWLGKEWLPEWWKTETQLQVKILSITIGCLGLLMICFVAIASRIARRGTNEPKRRERLEGARVRIRPPSWQFGLRHVMFMMAPIALFFVLIREFGWSTLSVLALLVPPVLVVTAFLAVAGRRTLHRDALLQVLAMAARSGQSLGPAIAAFAPSCRGKYARKVDMLAFHLENGDSLPQALNRVPKVLSRTGATVARVGWETGTLSRMLDDAVAASAAEKAARGHATSSIAYMLGVLTVICALSAFLTTFIGPRLGNIFRDFQAQASGPFDKAIAPGDATIDLLDPRHPTSPIVLAFLIGGAVVAAILFSVLLIRRFFDAVPMFDLLNRRGHAAVILRAHAAAIENRQTVSATLSRLAATYPYSRIRERLQKASRRVTRGEPWVNALRVEGVISQTDAALLGSAERVGNLPWALRQTAESGQRRQTYHLLALGQILQTVTLGGLGLLVFVFAYSYFRPLVILIDAMSRYF